MRASRLLSILILLQLRGRLTAEALAAEFEVSVRTVYRDIEALSAAGVPVYADRGPGGGFALLDGYRTRLTGLTATEAESLFLAGLPGPAAELGLKATMRAAQAKLLAALPEGRSVERIASRFHLDPTEWYQAAETSPRLPAVAQAVWDERCLWLRYESWAGTRERVVEPLGLVLKGGAWYLVAAVGADRRTYKVASILAHHVLTDKAFTRPADFDLADHWAASQRRFEAQLRPNRAQVRASPLGLTRIEALGAYARRAVAQAAPAEADGWRTLDLPIEGLDYAARQLLGLGPEVVVLAPAELRFRLRELAQGVATLHRNSS
ncbi:helix-turn-helix transcriptional regulator [Salinarimonas soli]|uniref:WYL domain-containing protein n=1 Tax=Salinarimonas soli TaxID=1638099 RepID=A0A5B2V8I9_9HYPH|nr:WYL domain-containing protein [Salinarimonas soli]KAA2234752.1 WYL domain-containing protein [Salinarimonas soli]